MAPRSAPSDVSESSKRWVRCGDTEGTRYRALRSLQDHAAYPRQERLRGERRCSRRRVLGVPEVADERASVGRGHGGLWASSDRRDPFGFLTRNGWPLSSRNKSFQA